MKTTLIIPGACWLLLSITDIQAQTPQIADTQHQFTYDANGNRIKREQIAITVILRNANPDSTQEEITAQEQNFNDEQANTTAQNPNNTNNEQIGATLPESSALKEHKLFLAGHTIKAYPNPVDQVLNLEIAGLDTKPHNLVRIYEMNGRLILEKRLDSNQQLDFASYSAGTYLLVVWIDGKKKEIEVIKH